MPGYLKFYVECGRLIMSTVAYFAIAQKVMKKSDNIEWRLLLLLFLRILKILPSCKVQERDIFCFIFDLRDVRV